MSSSNYEMCDAVLRASMRQIADDVAGLTASVSSCERLHWRTAIPSSDAFGVYLLFGGDGALLYVGKAEQALGKEVWSKLRRGESDGDIRWATGPAEQPAPHHIATVALDARTSYLAPALETLLIRKLKPQLNVLGKRE